MKKLIVSYIKLTNNISKTLSKYFKWIALILVLIVTYEVIARYVFGSPTVWGYDMMSMTGATLGVMAWAYVEFKEEHVRVDVFYDKLSTAGKAVVDFIGGVVFGLPLILVYIRTSFIWLIKAYKTGEVLSTSFWYPSAVPIRIIVLLGFLLFFLQFLNTFIRQFYFLLKGEKLWV